MKKQIKKNDFIDSLAKTPAGKKIISEMGITNTEGTADVPFPLALFVDENAPATPEELKAFKELVTNKPDLEKVLADGEEKDFVMPTIEVSLDVFSWAQIISYLQENEYLIFDAEDDESISTYLRQRDHLVVSHTGNELEAVKDYLGDNYPNVQLIELSKDNTFILNKNANIKEMDLHEALMSALLRYNTDTITNILKDLP